MCKSASNFIDHQTKNHAQIICEEFYNNSIIFWNLIVVKFLFFLVKCVNFGNVRTWCTMYIEYGQKGWTNPKFYWPPNKNSCTNFCVGVLTFFLTVQAMRLALYRSFGNPILARLASLGVPYMISVHADNSFITQLASNII